MSHIWKFSPESELLLQQCLKAAAPPDESNIWIQKFGLKNVTLVKKVDDSILLEDSPDTTMVTAPQIKLEEDTNRFEEFADPDLDIISKFNYLQEKCESNPKLLTQLAQNLPTNTLQTLIQHIFDSKINNNPFLEQFFMNLLPIFIKRDNSRLSSDLLLKTHKLYPQYLLILLKVILKDVDLQNTIINDFILSLNVNELNECVNNIIGVELSGEQFIHNLFNIYTAYKNCTKTDNIQNNISSLLKTHSQSCTIDKNYGKLLLAYLQHEKSLNRERNVIVMEEIIEIHKSPFKRLCLAVLKELKSNS